MPVQLPALRIVKPFVQRWTVLKPDLRSTAEARGYYWGYSAEKKSIDKVLTAFSMPYSVAVPPPTSNTKKSRQAQNDALMPLVAFFYPDKAGEIHLQDWDSIESTRIDQHRLALKKRGLVSPDYFISHLVELLPHFILDKYFSHGLRNPAFRDGISTMDHTSLSAFVN